MPYLETFEDISHSRVYIDARVALFAYLMHTVLPRLLTVLS